jgi:hypothetical protein
VACPSCGFPVAKTLADPQQEKAKTEKSGMSGAGFLGRLWRWNRQTKMPEGGFLVILGALWLLWGIWDAIVHNSPWSNDHILVGLTMLLIAGIFIAVKKK